MHYNDRFTLPQDSQHTVESIWFDSQKQRRITNNDPVLRHCLDSEVDALKAFHDGHTNAAEAAHAITRPISTSPVPTLGSYSDGTVAVITLWLVLVTALMEWPTARTPDLLTLLCDIGKTPDTLHNGEVPDDDDGRLTWTEFPYFALAWNEGGAANITAGQICRQYADAASLGLARRIYLKMKDVEAQLLARRVIGWGNLMVHTLFRALEKPVDEGDRRRAANEATAYTQVKLDFHVPAICSLFKYNGRDLYRKVVLGVQPFTRGQMPDEAMRFEDGAERWLLWKMRLAELAVGDFDDHVKVAARETLECMAAEEDRL